MLYDEPLKLNELRSDLAFYSVPFDKIVAAVCPEAKLRKLVKNMIYVGVVAQLLNLDMTEVEKALRKQFAKKVKAADLNWNAAKAGYDYAAASLTKSDPFTIERMNKTAGKIIIDGNSAAAHGLHVCRRHGGDVVSDYAFVVAGGDPDRLHEGLPRRAGRQSDFRHRAGGRRTGGDRHGAGRRMGWRALDDGDRRTGNFADGGVCRAGLLRRDSRRDLGRAARRAIDRTADAHLAGRHRVRRQSLARRHEAPHADSVLGGGMLHMASEAFDLAEQLQTPVFVMSDLDLGMNNWMSEPFEYPEKPLNRGKVLTQEDLTGWADLRATRMWTATASAIARCRAPIIRRRRSSRAAAATTRSAQYSERPDDYPNNMDRLRTSSRPRARWFPSRRWFATTATKSASSPTARRITRWSRGSISCSTEHGVHDGLPAPAGVSVHARRCRSSLPRTNGFTWLTRIAMRRC